MEVYKTCLGVLVFDGARFLVVFDRFLFVFLIFFDGVGMGSLLGHDPDGPAPLCTVPKTTPGPPAQKLAHFRHLLLLKLRLTKRVLKSKKRRCLSFRFF